MDFILFLQKRDSIVAAWQSHEIILTIPPKIINKFRRIND
ncbi:hypothetical protein RAMDARK_1974 [Rickettsia amblyommatis str. Darkwater]|uniref:Uncharacterized protein n=1 Tax=Rickettsia amblyommatis str. Ac/Pa TaxID=1359164 RepID=A0A0F3N150_RICAM|nr:hypothetical protein APHACPA_0647 [Rickettsia amblyommatis str. Ac/Pa]KJV97515.1 hypothetical protein RAMDARK_0427 [Rickettsia amblyommatis str. Darkwater]KJV98495.1 hypothetical protein RAMDARK_1974 [Rickettsia amblyommatis str. Darkwater]